MALLAVPLPNVEETPDKKPGRKRKHTKTHGRNAHGYRERKAQGGLSVKQSAAIAELASTYEQESRIESVAAKKALAESLAICVLRQRQLYALELSGALQVDIAKTLPALASHIKRLIEILGLSSEAPPSIDDL